MCTLLDFIRLLLITIGAILVACSVLVVLVEHIDSTIIGEQTYFQLSMLWLALGVLFAVITGRGKVFFKFTSTDWLIAVAILIIISIYPRDLNPAPDKFALIILVFALWFLLRIVLFNYSYLSSFFLFILIFAAFVEAIWGIGQTFRLFKSQGDTHLSGSFFSSKQYTAYLSVLFPVCMSMVLRYRNCNKKHWWNIHTITYYFSLLASVFILIILPSGMYCAAFVAAMASCLFVFYTKLSWKYKLQFQFQPHHKLVIIGLVTVLLGVVTVLSTLFLTKNDFSTKLAWSWQVSSAAIAESPVLGNGTGSFLSIVDKYEKELLARDKIFLSETPLLAKNEYLKIVLEYGFVGLILFLCVLGICIYKGIKNRQFGAAGGLISLLILYSTSELLQQPSFFILLPFLASICLVNRNAIQTKQALFERMYAWIMTNSIGRRQFTTCFALGITLIVYLIFASHKSKYNVFGSLNGQKFFTESGGTEFDYSRLEHYPSYVFEYAQLLSDAKLYAQSNELLMRAKHLSNNPLKYKLLSENYHALGKYNDAEKQLKIAINMCPDKLSSYYSLAKLYAEPNFFHPEKMKETAQYVLNKGVFTYSSLSKKKLKEIQRLAQ